MELDVPIITATQLNRGGIGATDVDMTDTSECIFVDEKVKLRSGEEIRIADQLECFLANTRAQCAIHLIGDGARVDC